MKWLEIKNIDVGGQSPEAYAPAISENFCIWITLLVGEMAQEGGTLFDVGVCTPRWLEHQIKLNHPSKPFSLRHYLVVEKYDYEAIKATIIEITNNAKRETIEEAYSVLARHFAWEFEDYAI